MSTDLTTGFRWLRRLTTSSAALLAALAVASQHVAALGSSHLLHYLYSAGTVFTGELLVIHDEDPQAAAERGAVAHAVMRASACISGTSMRARVPLPGSLKSVNWYDAP